MLPCGRGLRTPTYPTHLCVCQQRPRALRRSAAPPLRRPAPRRNTKERPGNDGCPRLPEHRCNRARAPANRPEPDQRAPAASADGEPAGRRAQGAEPGCGLTPMDKVIVLPARNGLRACDYSLGGSCCAPRLILRASGCARRAAGRRRQPPRRRCLRREAPASRPSGKAAPVA